MTALPSISFTTECEFYNQTLCQTGKGKCNVTETCGKPGDGKRSHCFAYWSNVSGLVEVIMKGCWLNSEACYNRPTCIVQDSPTKDTYYCCCEGDLCNSVVRYDDTYSSTAVPESSLTSSLGMWTDNCTLT